MRKYLYSLFCLKIILSVHVYGQSNIPNGVTAPAAATAKKRPANYISTPKDYLRTYTSLKPIQDTSLITITSLVEDINITTQYSDSYGRPLQTITRQASPLKKDYVAPVVYDEFGRAATQYLPFVPPTGNNTDGKFKADAFYQDSSFYKNNFPTENTSYGQLTFDGSPYNMITKITAPGNSWTGASVGMSYTHRTNTISDSVRLWTIAISSENDVPSSSLTYISGSLVAEQTTDEKGIKSIVYKDELGRTVLTKSQLATSPSSGHAGWLCTYYVYDEMNHLRMIIPPKAVEALNTPSVNWNLAGNATIVSGLCYYYWYDNRGRPITKFIPGKGKTYIAYDLFDRMVMTQDAQLRITNQWAFIKFDGQSRPVKSGLITSALIKDSIIAQAARNTDYPVLTGTFTVTTEAYYDDYGWIAVTGAPVTSSLVTTNINGTNFNTNYNSAPEYAQPITATGRIRGMVTGLKNLILGTANYLYAVKIYDDHGRTIQVKKTNYSSGTDVATTQYNFTGRTIRLHVQHQKSGTNAQTHTLLTKYSYDHTGRIKTVVKNLDNLGDKIISQQTYNELGQLQTKSISPTGGTGGTPVETQNFEYNIRGWLTAINKSYITTAGSTSNYFGEQLSYDYGFTNNQYNGAIAGAKWKAAGDGIARAYGFSYDNANRLTIAEFSQQNSGSTSWTNDKVDYKVDNITYDAGSNITSMRQKGLLLGNSATIDSLTYQYFSNSNQLQKVADGIANAIGGLGDFKDTALTGDDYTYDVNGNVTKDNNRHLHTSTNGNGAAYNMLDKPDSLVIAGKASLYYYYDASGAKLRKQVKDYTSGTLVTKNYLYINGFVYLNDTLQYILQEEGRIRYAQKRNSTTGATYYAFEYDYFIRDHLGNVRAVLTEGRDTAVYGATMESADSITVRALFSNVYDPVNTVVAKPTGFDAVSGNQKVARLNAIAGVNKKIGPSLVLKVMAGDKVQINTYAFYNTATQAPVGGVNLLSEILSAFSGGVVNSSSGKYGSGDLAGISSGLSPGVSQFLTNDRSFDNTKPKAYLNWILFDDQFKYVSSNSGVQQVQPGSSKQALVAPLQVIPKNGFIYIYVSNESPQDVYFDDIVVKHFTGPLVQEQAYYPFGLQMAGISGKALNKLSSQFKFNGGTELEEDYGVNLYSTFFRQYDPQLGRFNGIDILSERSVGLSTYQFGNNNPVFFNDPTGAISQEQYQQVVDVLWGSENGGSWNAGGGGGGSYNMFTSGDQAFMFGAMQMGQNGGWGGGDGWAGSFEEALQRYNGGTITAAMAAEYHQVTWGAQASNVTAVSVQGGFNIGYTATSSGNSYSDYFVSTESIKESFDFLTGLYGNESKNHWVETTNTALTWGINGMTTYQFRIYGASEGWKFLGDIPGNQGWWTNKSGIYKSISKIEKGAEELSTLKTVAKFEKVAKFGFGATTVLSVVSMYDHIQEGEGAKAVMDGVDIAMSALGTFGGPIGFAVSLGYFAGRAFDWW